MTNFSDKIAIVTGATRGIGHAIATKLCAEGAVVIGFGRSKEAGEAFERDVPGVQFMQVDVADGQQVQDGVRAVVERHGAIDFLVCNAGITRDRLVLRMTPADWSAVIDVNLTGTYHCIRAALRHLLRSSHSAIVAISSVVGEMGNPGQANYAASKAGMVAFCRSVAKEVGGRGLRINVVAPGFIESDMTDALTEEIRAAYVKRVPLRRAGTTQEVAEVVSFLLSSRASYITGQVVGVNGGLYP